MKSKVIITAIAFLLIWSCNQTPKTIQQPDFNFPKTLTEMGFFKGRIYDLEPDSGIIKYQLSSTLFTDYAEKQRLIKLPKGEKMIVKGDGLLLFPEGTMIAKTFFYSNTDSQKEKQIIETRLLILKNGKWFAGTYKWNKDQTEADYTTNSSVVPVKSLNGSGKYQQINYRIPSAADCQSCHRSSDEVIPIGPKAMNLNRDIKHEGKDINQLEFFRNQHVLSDSGDLHKIASLPNYEDSSINLEQRARAYMEVNCAHCHNPKGLAYRQSVKFEYGIPLKGTGIEFFRDNIIDRMGTMGALHMPQSGTTVLDKEGVKLIKTYLSDLP